MKYEGLFYLFFFLPPVPLLAGFVSVTPMGFIPTLHGVEQLQQKAEIKNTQFTLEPG